MWSFVQKYWSCCQLMDCSSLNEESKHFLETKSFNWERDWEKSEWKCWTYGEYKNVFAAWIVLDSVTRWRDHFFNIWPFTQMKFWTNSTQNCQSRFENSAKFSINSTPKNCWRLFKFFQSGKIIISGHTLPVKRYPVHITSMIQIQADGSGQVNND